MLDTAGYPYHDDCPLPEQTPLAPAVPTGEQHQIEQDRGTRRYTADRQLATLLAVKEILADGTCKNVQEACERVNLHPATYYRYQRRFQDVIPTQPICTMSAKEILAALRVITEESRGGTGPELNKVLNAHKFDRSVYMELIDHSKHNRLQYAADHRLPIWQNGRLTLPKIPKGTYQTEPLPPGLKPTNGQPARPQNSTPPYLGNNQSFLENPDHSAPPEKPAIPATPPPSLAFPAPLDAPAPASKDPSAVMEDLSHRRRRPDEQFTLYLAVRLLIDGQSKKITMACRALGISCRSYQNYSKQFLGRDPTPAVSEAAMSLAQKHLPQMLVQPADLLATLKENPKSRHPDVQFTKYLAVQTLIADNRMHIKQACDALDISVHSFQRYKNKFGERKPTPTMSEAAALLAQEHQLQESQITEKRHDQSEEQLHLYLAVLFVLQEHDISEASACDVLEIPLERFHYYRQKFKEISITPGQRIRALEHLRALNGTISQKLDTALRKKIAGTAAPSTTPNPASLQPKYPEKTVFEAILMHGNDDCFEPTGDGDGFIPTNAIPGTQEKIEILSTRIERGHPLHHPEDYTLLDAKERR